MKRDSLRYRQIHLDFHTSPEIAEIGSAFEKREWQETLKRASVDSITLFSKCHHGLSYHPTKVGQTHPHLHFDLLRAQIEACREIDINTPIYLSAGLDNTITQLHPEWREITPDGRYAGWVDSPIKPGFHKMCFHTPYVDYLCRQIEEAVTLFPEANGVFLDIIFQTPCCCNWCLDVMAKSGLNAEKEADRLKASDLALERYYRMSTEACRIKNAQMPVFHNNGHIPRGRRDLLAYQSHLELESLPTAGWGYDHFPESATYCGQLDRDYLGMTGKFHTGWGEFGGFKHPNALRYECSAMIALGARCSIGDQLHPTGRLDPSTYNLVAASYAEVAAKESWCKGSEPVTEIGVLSSESENPHTARMNAPDTGACRVLLEGHHLFALLDREMDFEKFRLLILPDDIRIDAPLQAKLEVYLQNGGKLLLTGESGFSKMSEDFIFNVGADFEQMSPFEPDFILPSPNFRPSFIQSPLVMYAPSLRMKVRAADGESLGQVFDPYFNRTFRHFCSHQHAPNQPEPSGYDCGVRKGNIVYLAHPIFTLYRRFGSVAYKEYVLKILDHLLEGKRIISNLPSAARLSYRRQPLLGRTIIHLYHANKHLRGGKITSGGSATANFDAEVIEELDPLHGIQLRVGDADRVRRVTCEPEGAEVKFAKAGNAIEFQLGPFACHQIVVLHE